MFLCSSGLGPERTRIYLGVTMCMNQAMEFFIFANIIGVLVCGQRSSLATSAARLYPVNIVCSKMCGGECFFLGGI